MQLVYEATGLPVQCGDVIHVGNSAHYVEQIVKPHKPGSTGRVYCISMDENKLFKEWFPSVIGVVWIDRTDQ